MVGTAARKRAAHWRGVERQTRVMVCATCVRHGDFVFGRCAPGKPCARCGEPLTDWGRVVGPSPFAGGIPFANEAR